MDIVRLQLRTMNVIASNSATSMATWSFGSLAPPHAFASVLDDPKSFQFVQRIGESCMEAATVPLYMDVLYHDDGNWRNR